MSQSLHLACGADAQPIL